MKPRTRPLGANGSGKTPLINGAGAIAIALVLSSPMASASTVSVTVVNQLVYPWLTQGAYADYSGVGSGGAPFVMLNGTVLLPSPPGGPPTLPEGTANISLDWMIQNRTADMAWLSASFSISGCGYSHAEALEHERCSSFSFSDTEVVHVNVTDGEGYVAGEPVGRLNFWGRPLLTADTTLAGTAFVNGTAYGVLSNVTAYPRMNLGIPIAAPGGTTTGPYDVYTTTNAEFGVGSDSVFEWESITGGREYNNGTLITVFPLYAPSGIYDYYNGLGIQISSPEYPFNQTVCSIQDGNAKNCQVTTYATTLGGYFRSGAATLDLTSTNIPLEPSLISTEAKTPGLPLGEIAAVSVASVFAASLIVFLVRKRRMGLGTSV